MCLNELASKLGSGEKIALAPTETVLRSVCCLSFVTEIHNYKMQAESAAAQAEMETIKGVYSAQEVKLVQHEEHVSDLLASVSQKLEHMT